MGNKMLIDATHPEETRVVVTRGNRVEEFDYESAARKQRRGNIYLAKVARIEPSLQAAFVNYGGNRHGFLAFAEIHSDYYQIPLAVREAMTREDEADRRAQNARLGAGVNSGNDELATDEANTSQSAATLPELSSEAQPADVVAVVDELPGDASMHGAIPLEAMLPAVVYEEFTAAIARAEEARDEIPAHPDDVETSPPSSDTATHTHGSSENGVEAPPRTVEPHSRVHAPEASAATYLTPESADAFPLTATENGSAGHHQTHETADRKTDHENRKWLAPQPDSEEGGVISVPEPAEQAPVEVVGSEDALEELPQRIKKRWRNYKIQEVIKRNQIVLIQVVKEERGTKGAALTTFLSLAGRYTVLMPNTASGGGISRKITVPADRKRLKEIAQELEVPEGMGLIIRTAGASRTKAEIKRDFEYLLRLWENVRDLTLKSTAPCLVYEEGDLVKRSIRDLYNKDIDEILVAGEDTYKEAKEFMRMLMPSHAKNVQLYKEPEPLFTKFEVERQLNQMFSPVVTLKSGGYIVLNQTEALVAIDVNSGRATREFSIEDTAVKTNCEAADEVARQIRLRDMAGLIVIDFIDMEERRNNRAVERRMKEALRNDRARIQVGHISHFGLLEMSRQRLRQGVVEVSTMPCPICQGVGHIRSTESVALMILRSIEDHLRTQGAAHLTASMAGEAALYILNQKRAYLHDIETRYHVTIVIAADEKAHGAHFAIERGAEVLPALIEEQKPAIDVKPAAVVQMDAIDHDEVRDESDEDDDEVAANATEEEKRNSRRRRRRRRGRPDSAADAGDLNENPSLTAAPNGYDASDHDHAPAVPKPDLEEHENSDGSFREVVSGEIKIDREETDSDSLVRNRRRGRRGGRRHRGDEPASAENAQLLQNGGVPGLGEQPMVPLDYSFQPVRAERAVERVSPAILPTAADEFVPITASAPVLPASSQSDENRETLAEHDHGRQAVQAEPHHSSGPETQKQNGVIAAPEPEVDIPAEIAVAVKAKPKEKPLRTGPTRKGWWQRSLS